MLIVNIIDSNFKNLTLKHVNLIFIGTIHYTKKWRFEYDNIKVKRNQKSLMQIQILEMNSNSILFFNINLSMIGLNILLVVCYYQ